MGLKINNMPMVPATALERAQGELKTAYAEIADLHMELESLGDGLEDTPPAKIQKKHTSVPASAPPPVASPALRADELREQAVLTRVAKAARNVLGMVDDGASREDMDAALQIMRKRLAELDALNPERTQAGEG